MSKSLLIVESPTKMKTLSKFLGKDFTIKATYGHIKDLPKSAIGVDVEKGFNPHFVLVKGKNKAVDEIRKAGNLADTIYIGSDPDREGEAIAFHVAELIGKKKNVQRVLFHEITKKGVLEALRILPLWMHQNTMHKKREGFLTGWSGTRSVLFSGKGSAMDFRRVACSRCR